MKLPDTNVWLAHTLSGHTHHSAARSWLEKQQEPGSIWFCRSTQHALLRLLTTAAIMSPFGIAPLSNYSAWKIYEAYCADDRIVFQPEPSGLTDIWHEWAARKTSSPKLWMDAYLAAFAKAAGAELVTVDRAFTQFAGLDTVVLAAES